jgi:methionine sulfoxide reductase heme-binding subunit
MVLKRRRIDLLRLAAHVGSLIPLALLLWDYATGDLSFDPIREATLRTGRAALALLVATLACTPVYILSGVRPVLALRKPLGMYATGYALIHLFIFIWFDYGLDLALIWDELRTKLYLQVGLLALFLLVPLAITSTRGWIRRLGRWWARLHWLIYPAGMLAVLHFVLLARAGRRAPVVYAVLLAALLVLRLPPLRRAILARTQPKT